MSFSLPVRVYIEDTDAGGIVYYVNYLKFMERSRTEFLRTLGYHKAAVMDGGLLMVVHAAEINYRRSARLDDELIITTDIANLARTYVEFKQTVTRGDELLCDGMVRVACVTADSMRPCPIPQGLREQLKHLCLSKN